MDPLLITAASGMKARMESLDLLANNIANSGTTGFKADQEFYSTLRDELPLIESRWTDFRQGTIQPTGNPLDIALEGDGFFALNSPTGIVYTRNGSLHVTPQNQLATPEGYTVRNTLNNGQPIAVDPNLAIDIDRDGIVRQNGQEIGQLELASFTDPAVLSKLGSSYFAHSNRAGAATASKAVVRQGAVEQSNVAPADASIRLISVMRQFEMLQRAMSIGAEMNKRAIDEVARAS
jgi:flagellar basal body rod protein FlgG